MNKISSSTLTITSHAIPPPSLSARLGFTFNVTFRHHSSRVPIPVPPRQSNCSSSLFALTSANLWLDGKCFSRHLTK